MKAVPQIGIVLGADTAATGNAFGHPTGNIGLVTIGLDGTGSLSLHSTSPEALLAIEVAFHEAGEQLRALIALGALQESARANTAPGADASDEGGAAAARGERPGEPVTVTSPELVAAPPSDPTDGAS